MKKGDIYDGPICYVGHDHVSADGRPLEGGWHYTAVVDQEVKDAAVAHAKAQVEIWEARAAKRGIGKFATEGLAAAKEHLAYIESASFEVPDEKLYMDETTGECRFAVAGDQSWHERHHQRKAIIAMGGVVGEPDTAEDIAATHEHLDNLLERLGDEGVHEHEEGHILTTPAEIFATKKWLDKLPAAAK